MEITCNVTGRTESALPCLAISRQTLGVCVPAVRLQPLVNARQDISRHEVLHADAIPVQTLGSGFP
ncbi:hypothetical protein [Paraburkholderia sp. JPY465]|uniref:hypothetical protein n=1 Tax=Paraburkholderia sp. JPY465 TaxID=3042285 RepID=UPI003D1B0057